jgi:hypothetical protein
MLVTIYHHDNSHTVFPGGIVVTPTGMLWNTESYTAVVEAVEEEVMDAARAVYFEILGLRTTVQTKGALEWEVIHGDTLTSLKSTQTEVWTNAVVDYVTNWENACDEPALAADIYDAAKAYIAAL